MLAMSKVTTNSLTSVCIHVIEAVQRVTVTTSGTSITTAA
jgi:hypothetical protein